MSAPLYANENFPHQVVLALRRRGYDVLTSREAGNAGRGVPDENVLAFATQSGRALLTLNRRDFFRLHRLAPNHAGIIACTQDPEPERQAERIEAAIAAAEGLVGCVLRVNRPDR